MSTSTENYYFSSDWFSHNIPSLTWLLDQLKPKRILEIGSFEGRSTVFFIEKALEHQENVEITCIDTWEGGAEHEGIWNMGQVEQNFIHNIQIAESSGLSENTDEGRYPQCETPYNSFRSG